MSILAINMVEISMEKIFSLKTLAVKNVWNNACDG